MLLQARIKAGIERILKDRVPGVVAVEAYTESVPSGTVYFAGVDLKAKLDENLGWSPADNSVRAAGPCRARHEIGRASCRERV